jgi:hypothetical protein
MWVCVYVTAYVFVWYSLCSALLNLSGYLTMALCIAVQLIDRDVTY